MKPCPYCNSLVQKIDPGNMGYPYKDDYGSVLMCKPCEAHVQIRPGWESILTVANAEDRKLRSKGARLFFGQLQNMNLTRREVENRLALAFGRSTNFAAETGSELRRLVECVTPQTVIQPPTPKPKRLTGWYVGECPKCDGSGTEFICECSECDGTGMVFVKD